MSLAIFAVCEFPRLKFIDDLALTQKMPLAVTDVALNVSEVIEKHGPPHAP
jgi:hypothetical protein